MKKTLLFLIVLLSVNFSFSQIHYNIKFDDFNGVNLSQIYSGWDEASGQDQPQSYGSSSWYSSDVLFESNHAAVSISSNSHDEWIVSPLFTVTQNTRINFKAALTLYHDDPEQGYFGFDDSVAVMISTDNGTTFESAGLTFDVNNQPDNKLSFYELNLQEYAGNDVKIAFYATDGDMDNSIAAFHLDDIVIKDAIAFDVQIDKILSPVKYQCYGSSHPLKIRLRNSGTEPLFTIPVRARIRGAEIDNIYGIYDQILNPGDTATFEVGSFDFSNFGNYELSFTSEFIDDSMNYNNSIENYQINNPQIKNLPSLLLDFTDYYTDNLSEIYPGWYEARGDEIPKVAKDVDWQADQYSGSRTASVYFIGLGTEDWIISPKFNIQNQSVLQLKASIEYDDGTSQMGSDDKLAIMISNDCGENWQELDNINQSSGLNDNFTNFTFNLSAYAGQNIIIGIYATTNEIMDDQSYIIHIDDLIIKNQYQNDAGITNIITPTNACSFSANETIKVLIKNWGINSISNFDVAYKLNNQSAVTETVNQSLNSNDEIEYTFSQTADLTTQNSHNLIVWTELSNDDYIYNDTAQKNINLSGFDLSTDGTFSMGFEDDEDFSDWLIEDLNNDNITWELIEDNQYSHSGDNSFGYFSNGSSSQSNDWLISPCFNLQAGVNYNISFYYKNRATVFPEKLKLSLGNSQSGTAMSQDIIDLGTIDNSEYLQAENTFSVSTSGEYYFGWHAYGDPDQFGMHIDDIEIYQIFDTDLTVSNVNVQRNKDANCSLLNSTEIYVDVVNIGNTSVSEIPVGYSVDGSSAEIQTFTQTLNSGDTITLTLTQNVDITPDQQHDIIVWTQNSSDLNSANDTLSLENFLISDFQTSFEPTDLFGNWTIENLQGANQWFLHYEQSAARTGNTTYSIRTDQNQNDDWLFSECFELEPDICYNLKFYYRSRFSYENLTVFIGNNNTNTAMNTQLFDDPNFYSNEYIEANIPFTVDEQGVYYFGWHTDGGTSSRYYIHLDDVSLNKDVNPPVINSIDTYIFDREVVFNADIDNPGDILWDFGDGNNSNEQNPTHIYENPGTYTVTLQVSDNCVVVEQSIDITIDCTMPEADFNYVIDGTTVDFSTTSIADFYSWNFDDGEFSDQQNPSHNYNVTTDTVFDVSLALYKSCGSDKTTKEIEILTSLSELSGNFKIYPNPVKNYLIIESAKISNYSVSVFDVTGKLFGKIKTNKNKTTYDTKNLKSGVYFIIISTRDKTFFSKFVKR